MSSSSPEPGDTGRLTVLTDHPAVTLTIRDHVWKVVESGIGGLSVDLRKGIYRVEAGLGRDVWSQHVLLRGNETVSVPDFNIKSAVPLATFTRSHESHEALFLQARQRTDYSFGSGSRIVLMVRNWSRQGEGGRDLPQLRLERWRGDVLAETCRSMEADVGIDRACAISIETTPGDYVMSMDGEFGTLSQTIPALPGWETQVFMLQDFSGSRGPVIARPTLTSTMAISSTDDNDRRLYELIEAGQQALASQRPALGDRVFTEIANGKFRAPILGLLAAHLLLMAEDHEKDSRFDRYSVAFDRERFEMILANTMDIFGGDQADIVALRTRSERVPVPSNIEISTPPIFWRSWELLLRANTAERPGLVRDNLWRRVSENANRAPFFSWTRVEHSRSSRRRVAQQDFRQSLKDEVALQEASQNLLPGELQFLAARLQPDANARFTEPVMKPTLDNLASYAPRSQLRDLVDEKHDIESVVESIALQSKIPYSAARRLLGQDTIDMLSKRRKE